MDPPRRYDRKALNTLYRAKLGRSMLRPYDRGVTATGSGLFVDGAAADDSAEDFGL